MTGTMLSLWWVALALLLVAVVPAVAILGAVRSSLHSLLPALLTVLCGSGWLVGIGALAWVSEEIGLIPLLGLPGIVLIGWFWSAALSPDRSPTVA